MRKCVGIVNTVYGSGSTGQLTKGIHDYACDLGYEAYVFYGRGKKVYSKNILRIDAKFEVIIHKALALLTGRQGSFSNIATFRLIRNIRNKNIKTIILLNLHGYYLNEFKFLKYLGKNDIRVIYITPDEYAGLGKCTYHKMCSKYITGCEKCPNVKDYPRSLFFDKSRMIFNAKNTSYSNIKDIVFVGPKNNVEVLRKSALTKRFRLIETDWGIDTNMYIPHYESWIFDKYDIPCDKIIILAVAQYSVPRKGIKEYFFPLAKKMEDSNYHFINVGYDGELKKDDLPQNMTIIPYVSDQKELSMIYSISDAYFLGSKEDSQPLTCLISLSCGTPLVCFNKSGLKNIAPNDGVICHFIESTDLNAVERTLCDINKKTDEISMACRNYSKKRYSNEIFNKRIMDLVKENEG